MTTAPSIATNPWHTHTARLLEVQPEIDGVATYRFQIPGSSPAKSYQFEPGQFNMLYLPGVGESAISMSGDPHQPDCWVHTVRIAGNVTRTLANIQPGETIGLRGPFGTGWPVSQLLQQDVILVAGGLGLAPLRPLIHTIVRRRAEFQKVWLIIGARTPENLLYTTEYAQWNAAGINVLVTVDRGSDQWSGNIGVVTTLLDRLVLTDAGQTHCVSCGPEVMMKYAAQSAERRGIPVEQIWVSMERNMQCAVGLCGHCQWGVEFVCKDGPVLRYDRVRNYFAVEAL